MNTNTSPIRIKACESCISYWGNWETADGMKTTSQYSTCMFCFRGAHVALIAAVGPAHGRADLYLDGAWEGTIDCYRAQPGSEAVFHKGGLSEQASHHLRIVARKDRSPASAGNILEIKGFEACEPVDYPKELNRQMEEEYSAIRSLRKAWQSPEDWAPVSDAASTPTGGVTPVCYTHLATWTAITACLSVGCTPASCGPIPLISTNTA